MSKPEMYVPINETMSIKEALIRLGITGLDKTMPSHTDISMYFIHLKDRISDPEFNNVDSVLAEIAILKSILDEELRTVQQNHENEDEYHRVWMMWMLILTAKETMEISFILAGKSLLTLLNK